MRNFKMTTKSNTSEAALKTMFILAILLKLFKNRMAVGNINISESVINRPPDGSKARICEIA